jgi:hypothetical protein
VTGHPDSSIDHLRGSLSARCEVRGAEASPRGSACTGVVPLDPQPEPVGARMHVTGPPPMRCGSLSLPHRAKLTA